ncbi:MAG: DNA repair protein RecN (Recombination protein N) [Cyclobacteriaceae bacterium]|jgi:DNA repair protein RecN (Recombination protein N)
MLSNLSIRNYALIRELEMSPSSSLNIITGETGAGKSIMLGAIGLLLGKRADTKILLSKETKCVIEGTFEIGKYNLIKEFKDADIDYEESTIIRREINQNGKSRAFINDIPTTLDVLKTIGLKLIDIHSQNESIEIAKKETRLKIVDDYAQNSIQHLAYKKAYANFKLAEITLSELITKQADFKKEDSYNTFLLNELLAASLKPNEVEGLESEIKILENSESIKLKLSQVTSEFQDSDYSTSDKLSQIGQSLGSIASLNDQLSNLNERFSSSLVELRDIIDEVRSLSENMEYDPERIDQINDRLSLIYQLQQKHQVNDATELISIQNNLESKIQVNENLEERIAEAKKSFEINQKQIQKTGKTLSSSREVVLKKFSKDINALLKEVGIPNGSIKMVITNKEPSSSGFDAIGILFSANAGIAPEPISKVASGGEFSRLMLCIKSILAEKSSLPTIIFDEIDTGVSGEVARKMGQMLKRMSKNHQLIAISHLPQIAAKGNSHYFVYKNEAKGSTESSIRKLNDQESLEQIAKMIGGNNPTNAALENAKELIKF